MLRRTRPLLGPAARRDQRQRQSTTFGCSSPPRGRGQAADPRVLIVELYRKCCWARNRYAAWLSPPANHPSGA